MATAAAADPEKRRSLEYWLARATDPYTIDDPAERQSFTDSFCDQINDELEGPSIAARLLIHEIQSPDAQRAMHALMVAFLFFYNFKNSRNFRFLTRVSNDAGRDSMPKWENSNSLMNSYDYCRQK
jgi:hypothetical protein